MVVLLNGIDEIKGDVIRTVASLCAAAAVTAPKSGGGSFSTRESHYLLKL